DHTIDRIVRALRDYIILGVTTNASWLRRVVTLPAFREGRVSTRFLADHEEALRHEAPEVVSKIAAALVAAPRGAAPNAKQGVRSVWDAIGSALSRDSGRGWPKAG
ncbi:MAG: hypothetical protein ACXVIJ_08615, partial [Thermoanaerobaculia bacterium]